MKKIITFLVILATSILSAQAPQKMSYQAVLRNTSNALITNATVGMRISILQGSATGTAVYVETQNPTTNANGLVSLEIGGGTPVTGTFSTINWSNGPFFIKTETAPGGGTNYTITGTTQLLSVPYALYAQSSKQQGKTTIILANDITDAQAAAQIAQELGPNTENIIIQNTTQLTTVDFSAVTSLINISITNNSALSNLNFNSLLKLYGELTIDSNINLTSFSMNNLSEASTFNISNNPYLVSINFDSLSNLYGDLAVNFNTSLSSLDFNSLTKSHAIGILSNNNLSSISFNNLISLNIINISGNNLLTTISFPLLASTVSEVSITFNNNLNAVFLPELTNCYQFNINSNFNLSSITIQNLLTSIYLDFSNNKFSSSSINAFLHKFLNVSPTDSKAINLTGQSPLAPPTGQGIIDKTTLLNTGNTVYTD